MNLMMRKIVVTALALIGAALVALSYIPLSLAMYFSGIKMEDIDNA